MAERYESFPVRGFAEGTFSTSMASRPNSPSTVIRCWLRCCPGTAKSLIRVRSGPDPGQ